jgi:hypothetical protein
MKHHLQWTGCSAVFHFLCVVALQTGALSIATLVIGLPLGFFDVEVVQAVGPVWRVIIDQALSCAAIFTVCALFAFWRPHRCFLAMTLSFIATELIFQRLSWLTGGVEQPWLFVILSLVLSAGCAFCGAVLGRALKRYKVDQVASGTLGVSFRPTVSPISNRNASQQE